MQTFRQLGLVCLISLSMPVTADPHYVQALDPIWYPDDVFESYLDGFSGPLEVKVKKYEGAKDPDVGYDMYLYVYGFDGEIWSRFTLDVSCPDNPPRRFGTKSKTDAAHIAYLEGPTFRPEPEKPTTGTTDTNEIWWTLDPDLKRQAVWFYSPAAPVDRRYLLEAENAAEEPRKGVIQAPSCSGYE